MTDSARRGMDTRPDRAVIRQHVHPAGPEIEPDQSPRPAGLLAWQQALGNRAVQRLIQRKLIVGPPNDQYELEADRIAHHVMSMPTPLSSPQRAHGDDDQIQTKPLAATITPLVQRQGDGSFQVGSDVESRLDSLRGSGHPLPDDVRADMEQRLGADFSGVRIHSDSESAQLNRALSAQAFTQGHDIYIGQGQYDPGSSSGKQLLVHELTHVIQQGAAPVASEAPPAAAWTERVPLSPAPGGQRPERARGENGVTGPDDTDADYHTRGESRSTILQQYAPSRAEGQTGAVQRQDWLTGAAIGAALGGLAGGVPGAMVGGAIGGMVGGLLAPATVTFPDYATIVGDGTVKSETDKAWEETLNATTKTSRREQGFWIRWNSKTNAFSITGRVTAAPVPNDKTASVNLPAKPADSGDDFTVASFHTHTPTTFRTVGRPVGPSTADENADKADNVAGVVYDYEPAKGGNIPAGHPLKAAAKRWHSGPNRRT